MPDATHRRWAAGPSWLPTAGIRSALLQAVQHRSFQQRVGTLRCCLPGEVVQPTAAGGTRHCSGQGRASVLAQHISLCSPVVGHGGVPVSVHSVLLLSHGVLQRGEAVGVWAP